MSWSIRTFASIISVAATYVAGCTVTPATSRGAIDSRVVDAVATHCEDLAVKFDKARSLAIGANIVVADIEVRYEEKQLISEDYLALRGMAYFSCAAFHRGDISHEEYVNSLFPIAALAEAVGKYMAKSSDAQAIQSLLEGVVRSAEQLKNGASVGTSTSESPLLTKYRKVRESPILKAYAAQIARASALNDDESVLMSEQIEQLNRVLADRGEVLKRLHDEIGASKRDNLWFSAFVLERDRVAQLDQRRFAGIDERFRRLERGDAGVAGAPSHATDAIAERYELVAYEDLDIGDLDAGMDSEAERRLASLCKSYGIWPYRAVVFGQSTRADKIVQQVGVVVGKLKACGLDVLQTRTEPISNASGWIRVMIVTRCSMGEMCVREQAG